MGCSNYSLSSDVIYFFLNGGCITGWFYRILYMYCVIYSLGKHSYFALKHVNKMFSFHSALLNKDLSYTLHKWSSGVNVTDLENKWSRKYIYQCLSVKIFSLMHIDKRVKVGTLVTLNIAVSPG